MPGKAWGKLNHGQSYGLLADDIARRFSTIRLGDYERLLLNHIREHSWACSTRRKAKGGAWPDAIPFTGTITAVAKEVCGDFVDEKDQRFKYVRKMLYDASSTLRRDRIVIETDGPIVGLLINTNASEWITCNRDFLQTSSGVEYALKAQNSSVEIDSPDTQINGHAYPDKWESVPNHLDTDTQINRHAYPDKWESHIERTRGIQTLEIEEDKRVCVNAGARESSFPQNAQQFGDWLSGRWNDDNAEYYTRECADWLVSGYALDQIIKSVLKSEGSRVTPGIGAIRWIATVLHREAAKQHFDAQASATLDRLAPAESPARSPPNSLAARQAAETDQRIALFDQHSKSRKEKPST